MGDICMWCKKELPANATTCPHCQAKVPEGVFFLKDPIVVTAVILCSIECFWLLSKFTSTPIWVAALVSVPIVLCIFLFVMWLGILDSAPQADKTNSESPRQDTFSNR